MDNLFFFILFSFIYFVVCVFYTIIFIWCMCLLGLVIETKEEVGVCNLILTLDVRPGYCSSVMYIWWACASCVCVCASMFGFWRNMALSLVHVRRSVALLLLSEPRLRRCTPLVLDRSFILRALCSACGGYIILPVLLSVPSPS